MKRLCSLLLLLPVLLVSCITYAPPASVTTGDADTALPTGTESQGETDTPPIIPPAINYDALAKANLDALPALDMEEAAFFLLTTRKETITPTLSENEDTGRRINTEILERNRRVEEKYNIRILTIEESEDVILEKIENAYMANVYLADLIELPSHLLGELVDDELAYNMNNLPFTDFTAPYYDQDAIKTCSAGYATYGVVGNANRYAHQSACLYFNATLIGTDASLLYDSARQGQWTWERLLSHAGAEEQPLLVMPEEWDMARLVLASGDASLLSSAYGAYPEAKEPEKVQACVDIVTRLQVVTNREMTFDDFAAGKALFYVGTPDMHAPLANVPFSWGILPLPKVAGSQKEYATLTQYQTVYVTTRRTMASPDRTGLVLQALNAATVGHIEDALRTDLLLTSAQSADAPNMLALFLSNQHYEFSYNFAIGYDSVKRAGVRAYLNAIDGEGSFADLYAEAEDNLLYWNPENFG